MQCVAHREESIVALKLISGNLSSQPHVSYMKDNVKDQKGTFTIHVAWSLSII